MTRRRALVLAAVAIAAASAPACGVSSVSESDAADPRVELADEPHEVLVPPPPPETAGPTTGDTTMSTTSASDSNSNSTSNRTSASTSVIRTDGGSVEVASDGSGLELVDMTTTDGWQADVTWPSADQLDVTFTRPGRRVELSVTLTPGGIRSWTSASSTA